MSDEEMARLFIIDEYGLRKDLEIWRIKQNEDLSRDFYAFIAGLEAGRPKRHDLRKNPDDLPKDNDEKLCFYGKGKVVARYDSKYGCWETYFNGFETVIPSSVIIAWCEIPKF